MELSKYTSNIVDHVTGRSLVVAFT